MPHTAFHPTVRDWFEEKFQAPTAPQATGWPAIRRGDNVLIAAPTGSGKTLAAFLSALDGLLSQGHELADQTQVLYVSPLKALGNDIRKNLDAPLAELRQRDPSLPLVRVSVRTGDTPQSERARMRRTPPHILVTTPESLYILLTTESGQGMLRSVRTVIVDEIHATLGDKRGSHLSLSLERLERLNGSVQRIGLSATQKPLEDVARFLVGVDRPCTLLDSGFMRELDAKVVIPETPLSAVCSHETWEEIYARIAALIREHKTTLVFVNTRKLAERVSARLRDELGDELVRCHHSSLSKERRLDAEQRLKEGSLRALVATASLELGIDVGDVDLTVQVGTTRSIATFLQRVGRAGHAVGRTPKGRLFPLTQDELVEAAALMRALRERELDRTPQPGQPLDILAQQIVATCVPEEWKEDELFDLVRRAWPYRNLTRAVFDEVVAVHTAGRGALLHRDGVGRRLMATRRARLTALQNGGAIPDNAEYRVIQEPEGLYIGSLDEDFAIESSQGDIFQLGNMSWRVLRVQAGTMRVADANGAPPTLPFWFGEAPGRTAELSQQVSRLREEWQGQDWLQREAGICAGAARQIHEYLSESKQVLGELPTQQRLVLERFFDDSGGMQLVLHSPFGGRINRAFGFALRKRFCRGFGFELQAATNEEAILLSLGPQHSFPLLEVFNYLNATSARDVLIQAILPSPMFKTRWRWNVTRALLLERMRGGRKVPPPLQRMKADDLMVEAFPQAMACPETLPGGDLPVPMENPLIRQTVEDCLTEAMDADGLLTLLTDLREGRIERHAVDTMEPSRLAHSILNAQPYSFLDDAPLEERRSQAVATPRGGPRAVAGMELDSQAVARVVDEVWPHARNAEDVHEALMWMGYVQADEAAGWRSWLEELQAAGRVVCEADRYFAVEATRDAKQVLLGRLQALGPVPDDDPLLLQLEAEGHVLRIRLEGKPAFCERRILYRIQRSMRDKRRQDVAPVPAAMFQQFLLRWQHLDPRHLLDGPRGVLEVVRQLAGLEVPAAAWERSVLPARIVKYQPAFLDELAFGGEIVWGRLWGQGASAIRSTPLCLLLREDLDSWLGLAQQAITEELSDLGHSLFDALSQRGALFPQELQRRCDVSSDDVEEGIAELIARGLVTGDSFASLRQWMVAPSRRRYSAKSWGRFSVFRQEPLPAPPIEFIARQLLRRTGVLFRRLLYREKQPVLWRDLLRELRLMELRGDVVGGRFVEGFSGEQFALPEAVSLLRKTQREKERVPLAVAAADPLNYGGILTPEDRVSPQTHKTVIVG